MTIRNRSHAWSGALVVLACVVFAVSTDAQDPQPGPLALDSWADSASHAEIVRLWMFRDCAVGDRGRLVAELEARRTDPNSELEKLFLTAFDQERPDLAAVEIQARRRLDLIRQQIAKGATFGLSAAALKRLSQGSADDFVNRATARARRAWRGASVSALGIVGGQSTLDRFDPQIWNQDPDRELIARARTQIERRIGGG